ncbi:hypothetical protein PJE062_5107 [Pseudovibrio sp. JE062]|nr:hypothetical protein PJE062_5107 [Pseudovibrio sp. JE062]
MAPLGINTLRGIFIAPTTTSASLQSPSSEQTQPKKSI